MSVTLDLPHELEDELAAEAAQLGLPLPEYILRVLSTTVATGDKPKTGADLVEYWQNEEVIGTDPISPTAMAMPDKFVAGRNAGRFKKHEGRNSKALARIDGEGGRYPMRSHQTSFENRHA